MWRLLPLFNSFALAIKALTSVETPLAYELYSLLEVPLSAILVAIKI